VDENNRLINLNPAVMKKILALSILVIATLVIRAQSRIGIELTSKENIVLYLIEQEKLARDLYGVLDTIWVTDVFNRMVNDELQHMDKLSAVAAEFMIDVPNHFNEYKPGQFVNADLRTLYLDLLADANFSLEDAYRACANLEERKIMNLRTALKEPNFDLEIATYKTLLIGAEDNLKFFIRALVEMNSGYLPILMSESEFEFLTRNILSNDNWQVINPNEKTRKIGLF
jgi:hypothetical protein